MSHSFEARATYDYSVPVIELSGELTSDAEETLLSAYEGIEAARRERVIMDFQEMRYINSSGIAILIQMITRANEAQHKIEFARLSSHFHKVMEIVGLADFVAIHDSVEDATG